MLKYVLIIGFVGAILLVATLTGGDERPTKTVTQAITQTVTLPAGSRATAQGDDASAAEKNPGAFGVAGTEVKNVESLRKLLTFTSYERTSILLRQLTRIQLKERSATVEDVQADSDGLIGAELKGSRRSLAITIDVRESGLLTIKVDGKTWKSVPTDAAAQNQDDTSIQTLEANP